MRHDPATPASPLEAGVRVSVALAIAVLLVAGGCRKDAPSLRENATVTTPPIEEVLKRHTPSLMAIPGVIGTYQGQLDDGRPCIGVMLAKRTPEIEQKIPRVLEGYPVRIEETGVIRPLEGGR